MKAIIAGVSLAAVLAPAWAADAGCALATFGQEKSRKELCGRDACRRAPLPVDVARMKELTEGKMAVFISHRFSTVRLADRIFVLENGTIS